MTTEQPLPTDRLGLAVLPPEECWRRLGEATIGRVALLDAGEPLMFPVTHGVVDHHIVFRTAAGTKLDAADHDKVLAFEVDDYDPVAHTGWSVVARGIGETIDDEDEIARYVETADVEPWLAAARAGTWVRIRVDEITGRQIV